MHAPPLIDLAQDHMLIGWAALTGIVAAASLVWAGRMADTARSQPRAVAVVLPLLTLYCLWHSLPPLAQLTHSLRK
jgi:hypothetical protein